MQRTDNFGENFVYSTREYLRHNWTIGLYISSVYIVVIFAIQKWQKTREAYRLSTALSVWNLLLAVFSIIGAYYSLPFTLSVLINKGVYDNEMLTLSA